MKKLILRLLIVFIFPITFVSCQGKSEENKKEETGKTSDEVVEDGKSLLWKIEGNGLETPSYLFGTMHMIAEEYFVFPDALKERIKSCNKIVMELPGLPDPKEAMEMMMAKEGETMKDIFTESQYDSVLTFGSEALNMSKSTFEMAFGKLKPFAIIAAITQMSFKGKVESYEMTLIKLSKDNDIEMGGLETVEQQLGFFSSISNEKIAEMIMGTLEKSGDDSEDEMKEMMQIYKDQDLDKLGKFMIESSPELMENEAVLLTDRNKNWIPKIEGFIKEGSTFVAVGAAHLVGEQGVIQLLKDQGYTLTPISTEK